MIPVIIEKEKDPVRITFAKDIKSHKMFTASIGQYPSKLFMKIAECIYDLDGDENTCWSSKNAPFDNLQYVTSIKITV